MAVNPSEKVAELLLCAIENNIEYVYVGILHCCSFT